MPGLQEYLKNPLVVLLVALLLVLPVLFWLANLPFYANMVFLAIMYGIAAMAWNLMEGYTGLFSLGHAVFFGVGAYTTMILMLYYDVTPWVGIWVAGIMAAITGFLLGFPLLRLRSHWFTLATIAVGEIFKLAFAHWDYVGGSRGLQSPIVGGGKALYYLQYTGPYVYVYVALFVLAIELVVLHRIINSRTGYYFQTIREDEVVAETLGIDTFRYKMLSLVISSFFTGLAGALYAIRFRYVDPFAVFDLITISTYMSIAGIIGGIYTFIGPVVGAFIFIPAAEFVRVKIVSAFPRYFGLHVAVVGILLLLISLALPEGVIGYLKRKGVLRRV
ncbi:branched-chain amino acid ABC transporter permease [Pyrofollis japonicus]|uniref:branched-chain amino acid ABC transporter permease n=1 Tax=Pyrofollis japonicus TaxID=3060460 RepID=UPI00295B47EF|nr:branched-chain amino acid ABC transporter permease [Pyrofollis japonicus]BEP17857.1 branched-chain amino acid ABC transporter permease [Pyrofollis japonicus]